MYSQYTHNCLSVNTPERKFSLMTLGERIFHARTVHAKLTQAVLAEATGMKQQVLSKLENGQIDKTAAIVKIAIACGVRPEWLDQESGPMLHQDSLDGLPLERQRLIYDAVGSGFV
jgi:transcriptional regulator with XRE-family HTH domain